MAVRTNFWKIPTRAPLGFINSHSPRRLRNTLELKLARFAIDRLLHARNAGYIREGLTACPAPQREQYDALVHGLEEQSQIWADSRKRAQRAQKRPRPEWWVRS